MGQNQSRSTAFDQELLSKTRLEKSFEKLLNVKFADSVKDGSIRKKFNLGLSRTTIDKSDVFACLCVCSSKRFPSESEEIQAFIDSLERETLLLKPSDDSYTLFLLSSFVICELVTANNVLDVSNPIRARAFVFLSTALFHMVVCTNVMVLQCSMEVGRIETLVASKKTVERKVLPQKFKALFESPNQQLKTNGTGLYTLSQHFSSKMGITPKDVGNDLQRVLQAFGWNEPGINDSFEKKFSDLRDFCNSVATLCADEANRFYAPKDVDTLFQAKRYEMSLTDIENELAKLYRDDAIQPRSRKFTESTRGRQFLFEAENEVLPNLIIKVLNLFEYYVNFSAGSKFSKYADVLAKVENGRLKLNTSGKDLEKLTNNSPIFWLDILVELDSVHVERLSSCNPFIACPSAFEFINNNNNNTNKPEWFTNWDKAIFNQRKFIQLIEKSEYVGFDPALFKGHDGLFRRIEECFMMRLFTVSNE